MSHGFTAICRIAIGGGFLAQPKLSMRPWIGRDARRPSAQLLARALGTRDLVLGIGTLGADEPRSLRRWLMAALVADAADLLLTIGAGEQLPRRGRTLVSMIAGAGVLLGAGAIVGGRGD